MNEYDASATVVLVFGHCISKDFQLVVQNILSAHPGSTFQDFVDMQVYFYDVIRLHFLFALYFGLSRLRGFLCCIWQHCLLDLLCRHEDTTHGIVILDQRQQIGGQVKEFVGRKGVEFVEFCQVRAQCHIDGLLGTERFVQLVGKGLKGDFLQFGERPALQVFQEYLGIGLHHTLMAQSGRSIFYVHPHEMHVIIAIVHQIDFEVGRSRCLDIRRQEGDVQIQHIGTTTFQGTWTEGDFLFAGFQFLVTHRRHLLHSLFLRRTRWFLIRLRSGYIIIVCFNDHTLLDQNGDIKTILVLHQDCIFTLEASYHATSHIIQKSDFITYFHSCILVFLANLQFIFQHSIYRR